MRDVLERAGANRQAYGEIFYGPKEAHAVIEKWRIHYTIRRPHLALGYRPPAPRTLAPSPPTLEITSRFAWYNIGQAKSAS
jgi:transposase InsO family protein